MKIYNMEVKHFQTFLVIIQFLISRKEKKNICYVTNIITSKNRIKIDSNFTFLFSEGSILQIFDI